RRQVRDDRVTIPGIPSDQVIVHRALRGHVRDGPGLMDVEVRRSAQHTVAQGSTIFGMGLRGTELERCPSGLVGPCPEARKRGPHPYASRRPPHRRQERTSVHCWYQAVAALMVLHGPLLPSIYEV